jgi:hypothetical protein
MNWRPLLPCAGLLGGALAGWQMREPGAAGAASVVVEDWKAAQTAFVVPATSRAPAVMKLSELHNLWSADGTVGIYELLDSVPPATLAAWLDEMMPPETYNRSVEREKRDGIRDAIVERLAERDPSALAAWLLRVPKGHMGGDWLKPCVRALLEQNPPTATAMLARLEKVHSYTTRLRMEWQAERDPEAFFQQVLADKNIPPPEALAKWLADDPPRALAFANEHPDRCSSILSAIAAQGKAALEQFVAGLTAPDAQRHARRLLLGKAAGEGDTATVAQLLEQDGRNQNDFFQDAAFATLARMHPEKAEALMQQFADRPALAQPIFKELAQNHPERAAAILASEATQPGYWSDVYLLSRTWSLTDPAAAQSWLRGLPDKLSAKAMPAARDNAGDLPTDDWLALTRGLPINWNHASNFTSQILERTQDPAVLADWCATFPDTVREHLLHQFRQQLEDAAADDITRRVQATPSAETP